MDKDLLKTFGLNLRFERMRKGISQETLAEELNFSTVYISNVESGKCDLSISNAYKFSKYYDKTIDYLLHEKD